MAGFLYHTGVVALCPHGGMVTAVPSQSRVLLGGNPAVTFSDTFIIAVCAFTIAVVPHPCVKVQWLAPATRVMIGGQPAVLQNNPALCLAGDQAPQGPPIVGPGPDRVQGS
jgi:hypothetical protein